MSQNYSESEWQTRKRRIDPKLESAGWRVVPYRDGESLTAYDRCAIEEYPTDHGPADYALCAGGRILGIVEAKRVSLGPQNVLTQAERYARGATSNPFNFRGFRVPFLYATNGEVIWHHDVRQELSRSHQITHFHTPTAHEERLDELKQFLDRSSGATFQIVTEDKSDTGLFVGRTKLAKAWQLPQRPPTPEQDEGFAIEVRSAQKQAVIVGTIDMATKFAVYDFLDRFLGVRWFLPGRLFEVVPKCYRLVIADCAIRELPALSGRVLGYAGAGELYPDNADPQLGTPLVDYSDRKGVRIDTSRRSGHASRWAVRNLLSMDGRLSVSFHGHNFIRIFHYASYFKEHPDQRPYVARNDAQEQVRDERYECRTPLHPRFPPA